MIKIRRMTVEMGLTGEHWRDRNWRQKVIGQIEMQSGKCENIMLSAKNK